MTNCNLQQLAANFNCNLLQLAATCKIDAIATWTENAIDYVAFSLEISMYFYCKLQWNYYNVSVEPGIEAVGVNRIHVGTMRFFWLSEHRRCSRTLNSSRA